MAVLTAILTHLEGDLVEQQLDYLRHVAPQARFVVCHGGTRADYELLNTDDTLFIADPSLRGPHFDKSINEVLTAVYVRHVLDDPTVEFVYLIEYDHLILRGDFDRSLEALAEQSGAGLLAKQASPRNDSNWPHFLRLRDDQRLNDFIASISRRDDPAQRWGCLGTGLLIRRDALQAFCSISEVPPYYVELLVPTLLYHLGFGVADIDALGDLYSAVRWLPEFSVEQAVAEKRVGRTFVHPFKRLDALTTIRQARSDTNGR